MSKERLRTVCHVSPILKSPAIGAVRRAIGSLATWRLHMGYQSAEHTYLRPAFLTERGQLGIPINYQFAEGVFVLAAAHQ
jgi:hypothetical protein